MTRIEQQEVSPQAQVYMDVYASVFDALMTATAQARGERPFDHSSLNEQARRLTEAILQHARLVPED